MLLLRIVEIIADINHLSLFRAYGTLITYALFSYKTVVPNGTFNYKWLISTLYKNTILFSNLLFQIPHSRFTKNQYPKLNPLSRITLEITILSPSLTPLFKIVYSPICFSVCTSLRWKIFPLRLKM